MTGLFRVFLAAIPVVAGLSAAPVHATADGPDAWRVNGVAANDVLNIRAAPSAGSARVGTIPPGVDGVANHGCVGFLSLVEFERATPAQREAARGQVWCKVGFKQFIGWVAHRFLTEGDRAPDPFLGSLRGTEWQLIDLAGKPVEVSAWVGFRPDGAMAGQGGCNRLSARYVERSGAFLAGHVTATRKACPGAMMRTEMNLIRVLEAARDVAGSMWTMGLFDADGRLLATFKRRDWD